MVSVQQILALKEGRIDIGFGRVRQSDPAVTSITLREERLCAAIPQWSPLAKDSSPLQLGALDGQKIIVYPKEPRPSYADQVLNILLDHDVHPAEVQEVREIQT
ncbi:MAG: LysR family transcriptional regulator, partial [Paracoccaceae bacterium]|nr:LysR family transcriptional regulator [Paracoccaceae bacterium]